eukprot:2891390-Rhodomonas_salina.2
MVDGWLEQTSKAATICVTELSTAGKRCSRSANAVCVSSPAATRRKWSPSAPAAPPDSLLLCPAASDSDSSAVRSSLGVSMEHSEVLKTSSPCIRTIV